MSSSKDHQQQHRKKKNVYQERQSPFPVPIASITRETPNPNFWYHYTGKIHGEHVFVEHSGDISCLDRMGFFGGGLMSRGAPDTYAALPYVHLPTTDGDPEVVKIMRRRMYLRHMRWKKLLEKTASDEITGELSDDSLDEEFNSDIEYFPEVIDEMPPSQESPYQQSTTPISDQPTPPTEKTLANEKTGHWSWEEELTNQKEAVDSWENSDTNQNSDVWSCDNKSAIHRKDKESWVKTLTNEKQATDSWETMEADENFWSSEPVLTSNTNVESNNTSNVLQCDESFSYNKISNLEENENGESFHNSLTNIPNSCKSTSEQPDEQATEDNDNSDDGLSPPSKRLKLMNNEIPQLQEKTTSSWNTGESPAEQTWENKIPDDKSITKDAVENSCTDKSGMDVSFNYSESDMRSETTSIRRYSLLNSTAGANNWEEETNATSEEKTDILDIETKNEVEVENVHPYCLENDNAEASVKLNNIRDDLEAKTGMGEGEVIIADVKESASEPNGVREGDLGTKEVTERVVTLSSGVAKEISGAFTRTKVSEGTSKGAIVNKDKREGLSSAEEKIKGELGISGTKKEETKNPSECEGLTELTEYIVIDDSDIDDCAEPVQRKEKYKWKPVRKKDVFQFNEPLVLCFEEAFFLSYGLGCLTVKDSNNSNLNLTDLWCRFCNKQQFLPRYVAYHYFRSKGWVPKPSLLFGTDFLVYKVGPAFYHATYSVVVKTVWEGSNKEVEGYNHRKFTWNDLSGLNRVTEHVAKTLVYCYVIMPTDLTKEEKQSPHCISRMKVRIQVMNRWVSSEERDRNKVVDDIS